MNYYPLILPKKLLIAFSGIGIAMIVGVFYNAIQYGAVDEKWMYIGIGLNFISFLAVLIDIVRNPIKQRIVWIIFLSLFSILATFIYLVGREKILGIED